MRIKGQGQLYSQKNKIEKYSNVVDYISDNIYQDKQLLEKLNDT